MRWITRAALAIVLIGQSTASAQAPNPVSEHYRAYRAALEGGDLVAAENEAAAALAASETRDGDGGATAVLALNLAQVRLDAGLGAAAIAPAQRALGLAQARGAEARVDPLVARLLLGRAQLAGSEPAAAVQLRATIDEAATSGGYEEPGFLAARDLAISLRRESIFSAMPVWEIALRFAAVENKALWRAEAQIGIGEGLLSSSDTGRRPLTGTNIPPRSAARADEMFRGAIETLAPLLQTLSPSQNVTQLEHLFGRALMYRAIVTSLHASTNRDYERIPTYLAGDGVRPPCSFRIYRDPEATYPNDALSREAIGAVVVRLRITEAGAVQDVSVLASLGGPSFENAVTSVATHWRTEHIEEGRDCSRRMALYHPVRFMLVGGTFDAR